MCLARALAVVWRGGYNVEIMRCSVMVRVPLQLALQRLFMRMDEECEGRRECSDEEQIGDEETGEGELSKMKLLQRNWGNDEERRMHEGQSAEISMGQADEEELDACKYARMTKLQRIHVILEHRESLLAESMELIRSIRRRGRHLEATLVPYAAEFATSLHDNPPSVSGETTSPIPSNTMVCLMSAGPAGLNGCEVIWVQRSETVHEIE
ncbi:unnamed protein product [Protopolystoma xenopodis]|uniref:Uncharacterized protein n=1 Tax=Protopolystoma xenopodis TaxID=117903 RepID=A0A3S5CIN0_9PLAT|nr:unnamed protein product [Protopolystoma xenopodis]